jgi:quinoprotein relay system zinc metallohydrolase 2
MKLLWGLTLLFMSQQVLSVEALRVKQIAPGIYVHFGQHALPNTQNHGEIANIGFIVGQKCVAVIDSGGSPQQGLALKKAIQQITKTPICYVINTHVHPDHIYGNSAFQVKGVAFIGHHKLARAMAVRSAFYISRAQEQLGFQLTPKQIIPPTIEVKTKLILDLGTRKITLTAHPSAHTDNDLSVYDPQTKTLWLSDLLFRQHIPVIDGSLNGWLSELEKLEKNNYRYVIPGHGALITDWKNSLQPQKRYLTLIRNEIRVLLKQGKFLEEALKTIAYSEKKRWKLFEQFHRKNITTAFAELEWEELE